MRCDDARRELEEGLPPVRPTPGLRDHLETCPGCRAYADRLERLETALRDVGRSAPEVDERAFVTAVVGRLDRRGAARRAVRWFPLAAAAAVLLAVSVARLAKAPKAARPPEPGQPEIVVTLAPPVSGGVLAEPPTLSGAAGFVVGRDGSASEAELTELAALPPPPL